MSADEIVVPKWFPIQAVNGKYALSIPWELIAPFEAQAKINNGGQTLERLAERGGLSAAEAWCVMHGLPFFDFGRRRVSDADAFVYLANLVSVLNTKDAAIEKLSANVERLETIIGQEIGVHRCEQCGMAAEFDPDFTSWRGNQRQGESGVWQHRCPGLHPQAGYFQAKFFPGTAARPVSLSDASADAAVDHAVMVLNRALARDTKAVNALVKTRVACNAALADDPTIQVRDREGFRSVGLLSLLNGVFGLLDGGRGRIAAVIDDVTGEIVEFRRNR